MRRMSGWAARACLLAPLTLCVGVTATGCQVEPAFVDPGPDGPLGVWRFGLALADATGCSTTIAAGLSAQLIEIVGCLAPGGLESFAGDPGLSYGAAVNPHLEPPARAALAAALAESVGTMTINSAFRTLAQQYLLKKWEGTCGISIAATPGSSNHETGLAIDTPDHAAYRTALENHGWVWYGAGDAVHFDFAGPGAIDLRPYSVLAFQVLWNHNNPADLLVEDGDYGPATEARLAASPVDGLPSVPTCPALTDGGVLDLTGLVDATTAGDLGDGGAGRDGGGGGVGDAAVDGAAPRREVITGACAVAAGTLGGAPGPVGLWFLVVLLWRGRVDRGRRGR